MAVLFGLIAACGGDAFSTATNDGGVDASTDSGPCIPKTCPDLHWLCGDGNDGCGGTVHCGGCTTAGFACDVDHACRCKPLSCADQGFSCGSAPDGCGAVEQCPACPNGQTCGAGGDHKCGVGTCTARTCHDAAANCGTVSDGCNGTLNCGTCAAPDSCGGGGVKNQCGCTPETCAQLGVGCGTAGPSLQTCNKPIDCGGCAPPDSCGGGGKAGRCGCSPKTCQGMGWQCGTGVEPACNTTLDCKSCPNGAQCQNHSCGTCIAQTCADFGYTCGSFTDNCTGAVVKCGDPPTYDSNGDAACASRSPTHPYFYACACATSGSPNPSIVPEAGGFDAAGGNCGSGATPPEPGWDCIPAGTTGWCCAVSTYH